MGRECLACGRSSPPPFLSQAAMNTNEEAPNFWCFSPLTEVTSTQLRGSFVQGLPKFTSLSSRPLWPGRRVASAYPASGSKSINKAQTPKALGHFLYKTKWP